MPDVPSNPASRVASKEQSAGMKACLWCGDPVVMDGMKCLPCSDTAVKAWKAAARGK